MKLAIMQPYLFPYIGYFQLLNAVDRFVLFDDVAYINRGWINRNRILVNGQAHLFTVPLHNASQNVLIKDLELAVDDKWRAKFLRTLDLAYRRAPHYAPTMEIVTAVVNLRTSHLRDWLLVSLQRIHAYLEIPTRLIESSESCANRQLRGQERILDICRQEHADHYLNPIGGTDLYDHAAFAANGVRLSFVKAKPGSYPQFGAPFVPWLSIIDVLMFNPPQAIKVGFLREYELEEAHERIPPP